MAKAEGLTDDDIDAHPARRGRRRVRPDGAARPSTNSTRTPNLTDETWAALGEHLDERQRMDFVFTVGGYAMLAMAFNTFGVRAREGKVRTLALFPKPAAGSWTENWPELGTAPVDYTDSIDPEHWKLEQQAIFKKTWLKSAGSSGCPRRAATSPARCRRSDPARRSSSSRTRTTTVRAFYNMCRHRGNKLVWNDYPGEEVSGICRQFTCKYHAWRYALDGRPDLRPAGGRVLRPRQGRLRR